MPDLSKINLKFCHKLRQHCPAINTLHQQLPKPSFILNLVQFSRKNKTTFFKSSSNGMLHDGHLVGRHEMEKLTIRAIWNITQGHEWSELFIFLRALLTQTRKAICWFPTKHQFLQIVFRLKLQKFLSLAENPSEIRHATGPKRVSIERREKKPGRKYEKICF